MSIANRIEQAPACQVINLTDAERVAHYTGSGWKLARFEEGVLVEMFDPGTLDGLDDEIETAANQIVRAAANWIKSSAGEFWLVMCSCGQLCEPRQITMDDASFAHVSRVLAEQHMRAVCGD